MSDIIGLQDYKMDKEGQLLNNLDFINNTYVWARCEHCGELLILKQEGEINELCCRRCKNVVTGFMREAREKEVLAYMIRNKIKYI
ncbi:MAG TPA: hypothetical protein VIK86_00210 [Candidatus Paceibacterota bacterium]